MMVERAAASSFWWEARIALRSLRRRPAFTLFATLLLALGIGASTAVFALLDTVFSHPLAVSDPSRLVAVFRTARTATGEFTGFEPISWPDYRDVRRSSRNFSDFSLYQTFPMNFATGDHAERVQGMFATANYFSLLGLKPAYGRFFLPEEDAPGSASAVAVLSYARWRGLFSSDPGILGKKLIVNGRSFEIIGIAPKGFTGTDLSRAADLWIPLSVFRELSPYGKFFDQREYALFWCLARLKRGVAPGAGEVELEAIAQQLALDFPASAGDKGLTQVPLISTALPIRNRRTYINFGRTLALSFGLVLLVTGLSVGGLLLARGYEALREFAIRHAIGAGRLRALRPYLLEISMIFVLGGIVSLPIAGWGLDVLWLLRPPELANAGPDLRLGSSALGFAVLVVFTSAVLFAFLPAFRVLRPERFAALERASPIHGGRRWHGRGLAVAVQVALAFVALVAAGLYLRSFHTARNIDLGFDSTGLVVATVAPGDQGYDEARGRIFYQALLDRVRSLPGVQAATLSENRLLRGAVVRNEIFRDGEDAPVTSAQRLSHRINVVVPGFFRSVGISLLSGRDFDEADCVSCPPVTIINQTMARSLWPGESAVGKRIHLVAHDSPAVEIVGVVENARYREVFEEPEFFVYRPLAQTHVSAMTLHVRTSSAHPEDVLPVIRQELRAIDPQLPLAEPGTMDSFVAGALWFERISTLLLSSLSALALTLAILGVYAAAACSVARRRSEMGIRLALGATRISLQWLILRETGAVIGAGLVAGWILSFFGLRPAIAGQLHEVNAGDPGVYAVQALVLLAAGLLGGYLSSRQILEIDPALAVRLD